ncbi:hypothetical protein [Paenibacillus sp. UNC451MF]|uniref:hypothetical protein n=1 Tax=Paenibacillus sp. UNC451MF TaxID=1449063 RepID=UPI00048C2DD0|nr:hypothetical protein [Paenibacillus sp. UNC451MF]
MLQTFLFILLGFLDVIAILALIFKTFRWPFWEYWPQLTIIGSVLSVASYLNRMVLDIPSYDLVIQFTLCILLLRFLVKVSFVHAIDVSAIGYLSFNGILILVYFGLLGTGLVSTDDAQQPANWGTFIIQLSGELGSYLTAYLLFRFHYGFSFIMRPPHNLYLNRKVSGFKRIIAVVNTIGILTVCVSVYWVLNYHESVFILLLIIILSLAILVYLSYMRDLQD